MTALNSAILPEVDLEKPRLGYIQGPRTIPFLRKAISFGLNPYGTYFDLKAKFGSAFRITIFGETWGVLAGPDALEHVYLNRDGIFSAQNGLKALQPKNRKIGGQP